mmetsp:Transcript_9902/g.18619  ORF Transcript_9902/g.18619 Transcript_9902/m.18619 type:complete len:259 (+) Transcript_9902:91-867(+)
MGKRKSKASKQKQAKAKSATQKRRQHAKFKIPLTSDGTTQQLPNKKASTTSKINPSGGNQRKKILKATKPSHFAGIASQQKEGEDKDFEQEYKSLQERKQYELLQKTKPKRKDIEMTPAIFDMNKKLSTEQLMDNTTSHLQDMQELGKSRTQTDFGTEENPDSNLLQVLAAQKRREDFLAAQMKAANQKNKGDVFDGNSFWALRDDDSDHEQKEQKNNVATFNFAAPSFVVPTQTVPVSGPNSNGGLPTIYGEDDPDL